MQIKVYTPATFCPQCMGTKKFLESAQVDFTAIVATDSDIQTFKQAGYKSFPVVQLLDDNGNIEQTITGFRPTELKNLIASMENVAQCV